MPRLSIIIPVLGSAGESLRDSQNASRRDAATWETTLVSVLENRPPDCEILVVHNAPYADPYDLAGEIRFLPVAGGMGLVESVNEGIQASRGGVVHLLASGVEVAEDWTGPALEHFQDMRVASVAPVVVDSLDTRVTVASGLAYSCRWGRVVRTDIPTATANNTACSHTPRADILGPLVQAAFYRRSALELVGGFPRAVGDGLADADLALALRFAGFQSILEPRSIVLATADCLAVPRPGFRQGLAAERLFWRAAPVLGWGKSVAAHPLGVFIEFVKALPRPSALAALLGRALGVCQMGSHRAHHQWLLDVERAAAVLFRTERAGRLRIDGPHTTGPSSMAKSSRLSAQRAT